MPMMASVRPIESDEDDDDVTAAGALVVGAGGVSTSEGRVLGLGLARHDRVDPPDDVAVVVGLHRREGEGGAGAHRAAGRPALELLELPRLDAPALPGHRRDGLGDLVAVVVGDRLGQRRWWSSPSRSRQARTDTEDIG
jgi:hypothetical protein